MTKIVQVSISFETSFGDLELNWDDEEMSDEDLMQYAKECFLDDIYSFVKYNELMDVIHAEIIND